MCDIRIKPRIVPVKCLGEGAAAFWGCAEHEQAEPFKTQNKALYSGNR